MILLVSVIATSVAVYDFTQRVGKNNFGALISLVLALAFGRWIIYYSRKLMRQKDEAREASGL